MDFLDWLFGTRTSRPSAPRQEPTSHAPRETSPLPFQFPCRMYDPGEPIPPNTWYQRRSWNNTNFVQYQNEWPFHWTWTEDSPVKVSGISRDTRASDFVTLAQTPDFRLSLEREPDNPVNPHAHKVMASGTLHGQHVTRCIGYLPDGLATKYTDADLDIRPHKIFVPPTADLNLGVEIALLIRAARSQKRPQPTIAQREEDHDALQMSQPVTGMSAPYPHRSRIYATEILACGHPGERGYPANIEQRIAQGWRRYCRRCAKPRA